MKIYLCALSFLVSFSTFALPVHGANIRVMTQNQYLGVDLMPFFCRGRSSRVQCRPGRGAADRRRKQARGADAGACP